MFVNDDKNLLILSRFRELLGELLKVTIVSYLVFNLVELIVPGFISLFYDINKIAVLAVIVGALYIIFGGETSQDIGVDEKKSNMTMTAIISAVAAVILYLLLRKYGNISVLVAFFSFLIIFSISIILNKGDRE